MAENPEQPDSQSKPQDLDLEAQLDALLDDLEAVEPQTVPADLRKHTAPESVPVPETETEPAPEVQDLEPAVAPEPQPIEPMVVEAAAQTGPEPEPVMSEHVPQPVAESKATEAPAQDLDAIASLAASLLDQQIDATIDAASGPSQPAVGAASGGAEEADTVVDSVPEAEPETAGVDADAGQASAGNRVALGEDDLGAQIDALLNDVKAQSAPPASAEEPEPQTVLESSTAEPEPMPVGGEAVTENAVSGAVETTGDSSDAGAVSIEQIDAMLAESAEQAIEGAPEDQAAVPGTDEILAAQAEAEAEALEAEAMKQAQADTQALENAQPSETVEPQPAPAPVEAPAPEPVAVEPQPAPAAGATADDVAKELDEEPQPAAAALETAEAPQEPIAGEADVSREADAPVVIQRGALEKAQITMLHICGKVNRPLQRLSPEMRDTVGWIGVVTLGLGFAIFCYGLLF